MKQVVFFEKENNIEKKVFISDIGELVYRYVKDVKKTNNAIRWCNIHNVGDVFDCESYSLKIVG